MATIFAIIMAVAETVAVFAAVGAGIAYATGHDSAANIFANIAIVSFQIALAAASGMDIANMLATPSPPGAYSDLTKLDSSTLSEVTGYDQLPDALMDQPILEAGGSSAFEGKIVAENAQYFTETLHLSPEAAKIAGAEFSQTAVKQTFIQTAETAVKSQGGTTWIDRYLHHFNENALSGREVFSIFNNPFRDVKDFAQYIALNAGPKGAEVGTKGVYQLSLRNSKNFFGVIKARPFVKTTLKGAKYLGRSLAVPTTFYSAYDIGNAAQAALQATFPHF